MERPQSLQSFIKNSGVDVKRAQPAPAFPMRLKNTVINNQNMGEFAQYVTNSNSNNDNAYNTNLTLSGLNLGMFNATVNKNFDAESRLDLKYILQKTPLGKTPIGEGLSIDTKEIVGLYGRFKTGFTHTKEYGKKGDINANFFTVQVKFTLTNGVETNGGTANFYKNGKIRFSGGFVGKDSQIENQPELIRRFIVKKYTRGQVFLYNPFEYNNLSGQFRINGIILDMMRLNSKSQAYGFKSNYEPELSPMMYAVYEGHKYIIAKSDAIQISGAKNPKDLNAAYTKATRFFSMLKSKGEIKITAAIPNKTRKVVSKKATTCPKSRRPPCSQGYRAKKNPQGDECCYKIPKKQTARKSPVNAPKITYDKNGKVMIGKKKCEALTKTTLIQMAKKLGVVGIKDKNKKEKLCTMIKQFDLGNSNFKVGDKACVDYKKSDLVAMALEKGIEVDNSDTIKTLCEKLKIKQTKNRKEQANRTRMNKMINMEIKRNAEVEKIEKKRRLNKNSIRNDIEKLYGPRWIKKFKNVMNINKDVKELSNVLDNAVKYKNLVNKKGVLKKMPANDIKRNMVSEWKTARLQEYKKKLIQKEYGKHGNVVVNYIVTYNPSKTEIKKFIENYKKTRSNLTKSK